MGLSLYKSKRLPTLQPCVAAALMILCSILCYRGAHVILPGCVAAELREANITEAAAVALSSPEVSENVLTVEPALPAGFPLTEASASGQEEEGFQSLDSMLHWAIEHSDPDTLKQQARDASRFTEEELALKRQKIKDVVDAMKMPSDAEMMTVAIADLNNASASEAQQLHALEELLILVEPIDNANDLIKLDGVPALEKALRSQSAEVRTQAAWVLGMAAQNNPTVQAELLEKGTLEKLMRCADSKESSEDEAVKCFYAVSGILRNHLAGQDWFFDHGGVKLLADILKGEVPAGGSTRLKKKVVFLIGDLAEQAVAKRGNHADDSSGGAHEPKRKGEDKAGSTSARELQFGTSGRVSPDSEPIVLPLGGGSRGTETRSEEEDGDGKSPVLSLGGPVLQVQRGSSSPDDSVHESDKAKARVCASELGGTPGKACSAEESESSQSASDTGRVVEDGADGERASKKAGKGGKEEPTKKNVVEGPLGILDAWNSFVDKLHRGTDEAKANEPERKQEEGKDSGEDITGCSGCQSEEMEQGKKLGEGAFTESARTAEHGESRQAKAGGCEEAGPLGSRGQMWDPEFVGALLSLLGSTGKEQAHDLDMVEKVLYSVRSLLVSSKNKPHRTAFIRKSGLDNHLASLSSWLNSLGRGVQRIDDSISDDSYLRELQNLLDDVKHLMQ